ncbi:MAG TPA: maleylpyruvate isomerase N-terminal domain-containing protein [Thermomicrobiales bacterium]|nr:maleylpyruvate isomerase N-terminal domain-containing protein [Thermomicrobiales bacterium]
MTSPTIQEDPTDRSPEAARRALERLRRSWGGWLAAIAGVPPERMEEPGVCGSWSVRDLIGHVAFWDRHAIESGRSVLAGEPSAAIDWQAMNEREAAAAANCSVEDLRGEMEAAHAALLAFVEGAPADPEILVPMLARMADSTERHYDEHAVEVRAWRKRTGIGTTS